MHSVSFLVILFLAGISQAFAMPSLKKVELDGQNAFVGRLSGKEVRSQALSQLKLKGKRSVILFLSANCPCSASHEPALAALHAEFAKDFEFLAVHSNADESPKLAKAHFSKSGLSFPVIRDPKAKIADTFGALKTPHVYVLDKNGKILYQGGVDNSRHQPNAKKHFLKDALTAIRAGKEPPIKKARALGCMIRR